MNDKTNPTDNYIPTPQSLDEDGLLVGWSLEHENKNQSKPLGFVHDEKHQVAPETLEPILHNGPGHLMTIATTGAGKDVGCIIPALLRHKGPVIVIDPKGENYAITARARKEMGYNVILLDPYNISTKAPSDSFNPLDMILNFEGNEVDQSRMLAEMIVTQNPENKDPFWDKSAEQLISALLLYIAESSPLALQNLHELRYLLNQNLKEFIFTINEMSKSKNAECKLTANAIGATESKVLASILSTARSHTNFLAGSAIADATSRTSFDLEDIILGKPLSIYIVIPPDKIDTSSQIIRLWIGALLNLVMMRSQAPKERTLFILDEAAQLGTLKLLSKAITLLRGYGLQTWSFWQDLSQLKKLYPDWETLYNNCRVHQDFGITNSHLAQQVSTITGYPNQREILKLDNDEIILQIAGDEAVIAQRPNYLTDSVFNGQADANPFHTHDDDDELKPNHAQRRYRRRENKIFSESSETDNLKQQLKDAIKSAKEAVKKSNEATAEAKLAKLKLEQMVEKNKLKPENSKITSEEIHGG